MARAFSSIVTTDDLNAFVDGALDPIDAAGVAAAVYADTEKAATVACYRAQKDGLLALFGDVEYEPLPAAMRALLDGARPRLRRAS